MPLALTLPREIAAGAAAAGRATTTRWRPSTLNVLFFTVSVADGAFAMMLSLLFAGSLGVGSALLAAGLLLALPCVVIVVAGLLGIAHGVVYPAAVAVVVARAFLATVGPVLATQERSGTTVERLAAFATWVDSGLAVGPLIGGLVVARLGLPLLYNVLAVAIAGTLLVHHGAPGGRAVPDPTH